MCYCLLFVLSCALVTLAPGCDGQLGGVDSETLELAKKHYAIPRNFDRIVELTITSREAADDLIPLLHEMPDLIALYTTEVDLTDEELDKIGGLTRLVKLDIQDGGLRDEDLQFLARLDNLNQLNLLRNPIKGEGLMHLSNLKNLEILDLGSTLVTGPGIEKLEGLPNLRELRIRSTKVDDDGMSYVAELPHLRRLDFGKTEVTEKGLWKLVDCYWLVQPGFPDDIVGPDNDGKVRMRLRREMMIRFREARIEALQKARAEGKDVPPDTFVPFRLLCF